MGVNGIVRVCVFFVFGHPLAIYSMVEYILHQAQTEFEMNKCEHRYDASKNSQIHIPVLPCNTNEQNTRSIKLASETKTKTAGNKFISLVEIKLYVYCFIFVRNSSKTLSYMRLFA